MTSREKQFAELERLTFLAAEAKTTWIVDYYLDEIAKLLISLGYAEEPKW